MATLSKISTSVQGTCYISLLNEDMLASIFCRLPAPKSIAHCALTCKPWCHVINVHGILRRHRPPSLCGVFVEVTSEDGYSLIFSRCDQIAPQDLAEKIGNVPADLAASLPSGFWSIADSLDDLLLLRRRRKGANVHLLAIYHPITCDLMELPQLPIGEQCCFFAGAAMLRDGIGAPPLFKVVCVVTEWTSLDGWRLRTWVHSADSGNWDILPSRSCIGREGSSRCSLAARAGDALFSELPSSANKMVEDGLMLNMRTGRSSQLWLPSYQHSKAFVDDVGDGRGGDDEKLWFVFMDKLVLRLYSHPKQLENARYVGKHWSLEREVPLRPQVEELVGGDADVRRVLNVQSRNGYVFFLTDEYGYFAVRLRSMRVQRLSGMDRKYMGPIYPYMSS